LDVFEEASTTPLAEIHASQIPGVSFEFIFSYSAVYLATANSGKSQSGLLSLLHHKIRSCKDLP
jgi:hypothetical protein